LALSEYEQDRLDTMVRTLAPLISGKPIRDKTATLARRHREVVEDMRQRRATRPTDQKALVEAALADLAAMMDVQVRGKG
jgi:hypothetical protein